MTNERIEQVLRMRLPLLTLGETKVSRAEGLSYNTIRTRQDIAQLL